MKLTQMEHGEELSNYITQDKTFDPKDTSLYYLLLQRDESSLKFSIVDPGTDVVLVLGRHVVNQNESSEHFLKRLISEYPILDGEFKAVFLTFIYESKCLIPLQLFDPKKSIEYLEMASGRSIQDVSTFKHSKMGAVMITESFPEKDWFQKKYPNIKFYPNSSLLIETLSRKFQYDKRSILSVEIAGDKTEVLVFRNGKLLLNNVFETTNENDFAYYVLNTIQQLQLKPDNTQVLLSGEILKESRKYSTLASCFEKIQFNDELYRPNFGLSIDQTHLNEFTSIFNLYSCAS